MLDNISNGLTMVRSKVGKFLLIVYGVMLTIALVLGIHAAVINTQQDRAILQPISSASATLIDEAKRHDEMKERLTKLESKLNMYLEHLDIEKANRKMEK